MTSRYTNPGRAGVSGKNPPGLMILRVLILSKERIDFVLDVRVANVFQGVDLMSESTCDMI